MSHSPDKPGNHGFWGYLAQRVGHPKAKKLAHFIFTRPSVVALVHAHGDIAAFVGEVLDFLAGAFDIKGGSPIIVFLNHFFETFSSETREILEKLAADPENPELLAQANEAIDKEATHMTATGTFPKKPVVPTGNTLGRLILEWRKDEPAAADAFRKKLNATSGEVHAKFRAVFDHGGTLDQLKQIALMPTRMWAHQIDDMIEPMHQGLIASAYGKGMKRIDEEKQEFVRVLKIGGAVAKKAGTWADTELPKVKKLNKELDRSTGIGWLLAGGSVFVTTVVITLICISTLGK